MSKKIFEGKIHHRDFVDKVHEVYTKERVTARAVAPGVMAFYADNIGHIAGWSEKTGCGWILEPEAAREAYESTLRFAMANPEKVKQAAARLKAQGYNVK